MVRTQGTINDTIFNTSNEREIATVIALDESANFDSLHHETLLRKMQLYGIDETQNLLDKGLPQLKNPVCNY